MYAFHISLQSGDNGVGKGGGTFSAWCVSYAIIMLELV